MIVQPDGLTKYQRVELGPIVDGLRVVRSGLKGDETVIVEGIGKVRPNSKVNPEQTDMNKYASDQLAMETHIGQEPVDQLAATKALPSRAQRVSGVGSTGLLSAIGVTKPARDN